MLKLYTDESPGLKVDPVVVLVLSLGFIFSVVGLHGEFRFRSSFEEHGLIYIPPSFTQSLPRLLANSPREECLHVIPPSSKYFVAGRRGGNVINYLVNFNWYS